MMDGYFIVVKTRDTHEFVSIFDVTDKQAAYDIAMGKEANGYYVSIWHATRIYLTKE